MCASAPTEPARPSGTPDAASLAAEVRERLSGPRLAHVQAVVTTAREIARAGGWDAAVRAAAERAAWAHDAVKEEAPAAWRERIEAAGETPDPWAARRAPHLLHAQAGAAWAAGRGEADPEVLAAIRHHPTGWPDWGPVGRILYVADFCEPGRDHAAAVGAAALRATAGEGPRGLARASREVLRLRLAWMLERGQPIHPDSWRAWDAWLEEGGS